MDVSLATVHTKSGQGCTHAAHPGSSKVQVLAIDLCPNEGRASLGCKHHLQSSPKLRKHEAKGSVTGKRRVQRITLRGFMKELHKRTSGGKGEKRSKE